MSEKNQNNKKEECCNKCFDEGVSQLSYGGCSNSKCECHSSRLNKEEGKHICTGKDCCGSTSALEEGKKCECNCMPCDDAKHNVEGVSHCENIKCGLSPSPAVEEWCCYKNCAIDDAKIRKMLQQAREEGWQAGYLEGQKDANE